MRRWVVDKLRWWHWPIVCILTGITVAVIEQASSITVNKWAVCAVVVVSLGLVYQWRDSEREYILTMERVERDQAAFEARMEASRKERAQYKADLERLSMECLSCDGRGRVPKLGLDARQRIEFHQLWFSDE